jgi:5'-3' exonuclease
MILLDNTQIILSSIFVHYRTPQEINEDIIRHTTLNTYRMYKNMFGKEYDELVICQDAGNSWRKDIFPQYKINRKKNRSKDYDWDRIFEVMTQIRNEVAEVFPYKSIRVERCEADDVIAILTKHYHETEKVMVVSSDKDFIQLYRYPNVKVYSPSQKSIITCKNPEISLFEHIARGDSVDGIPNILSDDDTFEIDGKRQKPLSSKKLDSWSSSKSFPVEYTKNWERNQKLVDLSYIPEEYEKNILKEYVVPPVGSKSKIFDYFVQHKMKHLIENIQEF